MPATVVNSLILISVLWQVIPHNRLIIWCSVNVGFVFLRYVLLYFFKNTESNFLSFKVFMISCFFIAGVLFGSSGIFLVDYSRYEYIMFLYFIAGGMVVGSVGSYHNNLPVHFTYTLGVFFIPSISIYFSHMQIAAPMVILGSVFYIITSISAVRLNRDLSEFLGLRFDNMQLVASLNEEKQYTDKLNAELLKKNISLKELALVDPLTGLKNRRYLFDIVTRDIDSINKDILQQKTGNNKRSANNPKGYGVLIMDIDHFKLVNDQYGHDSGDFVLKTFSRILMNQVRSDDVVVRFGGEEFIVILKNTEEEYLSDLAETLRKNIEMETFEIRDGKKIAITCSLGFVFYPFIDHIDGHISLDQILFLADKALYYAKNNGRNRSVKAYFANDSEKQNYSVAEITENLSRAIDNHQIRFEICTCQ
jgi:diguanylate cyclase (GGDEF)-like protein